MPLKQASFYGGGMGALGASPIQRDYMLDPRRQLMIELMKSGTSTAPVQSPLEGMSRALTAGLGGYFGGAARQEMQDREARLGQDMATVLAGGQKKPWVNPGAIPDFAEAPLPPNALPASPVGQPSTAPAGGIPGMLAAGQNVQNPDLMPFMQQLALAEIGARSGTSMPANVQTAEWYRNATPEQRKAFEATQAQKFLDVGGAFVPQPRWGLTTEDQPIPKGLKPGEQPSVRGAQAEAEEAGKLTGKTRTQAQVDLPKIVDQATDMISLLDTAIEHPGMSTVIGAPGLTGIPAKLGAPIPGTDAADFVARLEQIKGKQFLEAFETLKGGGQITEVEGKKATQAISRMSTSQSEVEFKEAARELQTIIKKGVQRTVMKSGGGVQNAPGEDLLDKYAPRK